MRALLIPVLFAIALTLPGATRASYMHEDEWRNAVMIREMAATGPVLHPRLHGNLYPDYPPLYFWCALPVVHASGEVTPLATRLPSVIGAALMALGTALLGLRLGSARTGLVAGVLVSVIPILHLEERRAMIDPLFAGMACVSVALLASATRRTLILGSVALAITWLTKGPLGAVLIALALAGGEGLRVLVSKAPREEWRALFIRAAILALVVVAIAGLWFGYAYARYGSEFGHNLLYEQTWGRFRYIKQHEKPWSFYLTSTLPGLLPVLAFALSIRKTKLSLFSLGWFAAVLAFLSVCHTKRSYYLMPAYPAVALLAAGFFEFEPELPEWARVLWKRVISWALVAATVLGPLVGLYSSELRPFGIAVALGTGLGWIAFQLLCAQRKPGLGVAAACGLVLAAVSATVIPALERRHGQKDLAEKLRGIEHVAVSPGGIHREALCWFLASSPLEGTVNIESKTNGANPQGILEWLDRFPAGKAAVIIHRRDFDGELNPLRAGTRLVLLAASDEETSSDDFIALGRRN